MKEWPDVTNETLKILQIWHCFGMHCGVNDGQGGRKPTYGSCTGSEAGN